MATGTERSKTLHNFTMPGELRWGNRKFLRCMKVNSNGQIPSLRRFTTNNSSYSSDQHRHGNSIQHSRTTRDRERRREKDSSSEFLYRSHKVGSTPPPASNGGRRFSDHSDGIAAMREKVLLDLQTAADKMKDAIFKESLDKAEVSGSQSLLLPPATSVEGEMSKSWNLRMRQAACKSPMNISSKNGGSTAADGESTSTGGNDLTVDALKPNSGFSQMKTGLTAVADKSPPRLRSGGRVAAASWMKRERPKFSVALSKRDIEEDLFGMVGHRPARRPKKRAKIVQRQLDTLFPGLWLTEVTPDMYKVPESAP